MTRAAFYGACRGVQFCRRRDAHRHCAGAIVRWGNWENRAVWYSTPVNIQSFTTTFVFQIGVTSPNAADGFTFTIQNMGLSAQGGVGGALGYQSITPSVAVKFDLFNNAGEGINSTGFYTDGAAPTVPALDLTPSGVNLHSGDVMQAQLTYDGATLTLTLTDTVTGATFTASDADRYPEHSRFDMRRLSVSPAGPEARSPRRAFLTGHMRTIDLAKAARTPVIVH